MPCRHYIDPKGLVHFTADSHGAGEVFRYTMCERETTTYHAWGNRELVVVSSPVTCLPCIRAGDRWGRP